MVLREVSPLNSPFPSIDYCFKLHSKSTLGKDTGHIEGLDNQCPFMNGGRFAAVKRKQLIDSTDTRETLIKCPRRSLHKD